MLMMQEYMYSVDAMLVLHLPSVMVPKVINFLI